MGGCQFVYGTPDAHVLVYVYIPGKTKYHTDCDLGDARAEICRDPGSPPSSMQDHQIRITVIQNHRDSGTPRDPGSPS